MTAIERRWTSFHIRYENYYAALILEILQANMNMVADEADKQDADAQGIIDIANTVIDAQQMYLLLTSLYRRVGVIWGSRMIAEASRKANAIDKADVPTITRAIDHWSPEVATKRAAKIIATQKKQIANIVNRLAAAGKSNKELSTAVRDNPYIKAHSLIIGRTEVITGANKGAIEAANASQYQYVKTWHSQEDYKVRDPNNPYYRTRPKYSHQNVNGNTIAFDMPFLNTYGYIMFPGDPDAALENTINCRCFIELTMAVDEKGRLILKPKVTITVIQPSSRVPGSTITVGDVTITQPDPDITVIRPGDVPNRRTITF